MQPSTSRHNIKEETKNLLQSEAAAIQKNATPTPKENISKTSQEPGKVL